MSFSRKEALQYLRRAHEQKRLSHAYLISGPPGSGKRSLAADLAGLVNGTDPADVFSTKARAIVTAEPESKSRRIVIEQIRNLEHALQLQAFEGPPQSRDHFGGRSLATAGGERVSQNSGGTAQQFAAAVVERDAGSLAGYDFVALRPDSTGA